MQPFHRHAGLVALLNRANVDTDQIIPKQFLKRIERTGFGQFLFYDWRYLQDGQLDTTFELNQPRYSGATILVTGKNFGCGSSREHAPWSLLEYGFRVIIAPSFADIFKNNCFKNGMLPIGLPEPDVAEITRRSAETEGYTLNINLEEQVIEDSAQLLIKFSVPEFQRYRLLQGLDEIGLTLRYEADIASYEERQYGRKFSQINAD